MKTAIYRRVSTDEQAESGAGLEAQEDACRARAVRDGLAIIGMFTDEVSGSIGLEGRPALLDAIATLGKGDVLMVAKRDRIGRLDPLRLGMIEAAVARRGARIVSVAGEGTESDDPSNILMRRMVDAFAEYERLVIGARTKAAMRAKARRNERVGAVPFGFDLLDDGTTLTINATEQAVIARIKILRSEGFTLREIAAELTHQGVTTKEGKAKWSHQSIVKILARAA
jgi:DNA invertase Pin-like site-specific DNA recombinase